MQTQQARYGRGQGQVIGLLCLSCSLFGTKVIVPQPIIKAIPGVADSKDGKAREKAKELTVSSQYVADGNVISTACHIQL